MVAQRRRMNGLERAIARLFLTRPGRWFGLQVLPRLDRPLLWLSRGRVSMSLGQPILLLITVGAKSGHRRTTPLLYHRDGDNLVVLASAGGLPRHPAWYHNLRAHPEVDVLVGGGRARCIAREARGEERDRLWHQAVGYYAGYAAYEERFCRRKIPVIVLTPKRDGTA